MSDSTRLRVRVFAFIILAALAALPLAVSVARAEGEAAAATATAALPDLPIHIEADDVFYDVEAGIVRIESGVLMQAEDTELQSSGVDIDVKTGIVESPNPVRLSRNGLAFEGKAFQYNYNTGTGTVYLPLGCFGGVNITADDMAIEKNLLVLNNVKASTCDPEKLDYHLAARKIEVSSTGKAKVIKGKFYFAGRRIFKWPAYSFSLNLRQGEVQGPAVAKKSFALHPPKIGFDSYGGLLVGSVVDVPSPEPWIVKADVNYYYKYGLFPQFVAERENRLGVVRAGVGKQWKENSGYFRYLGGIEIWSLPNIEIDMKPIDLFGGGNPILLNWEFGRMRESSIGRPVKRAIGKIFYTQRFARYRNAQFFFIGDSRGALYSGNRKFGVTGAGIGFTMAWSERQMLSIHHMKFDKGGNSPLFYDRVDPNNKWFGYARVPIGKKIMLTLDTRYDSVAHVFDEVIYKVTKYFNCTSFSAGWQKERKQFSFNFRVTNLKRGGGK